jgi:hypothetical protein
VAVVITGAAMMITAIAAWSSASPGQTPDNTTPFKGRCLVLSGVGVPDNFADVRVLSGLSGYQMSHA